MAHSFARRTLCARVCITDVDSANLCVYSFACRAFAQVEKGGAGGTSVLLYGPHQGGWSPNEWARVSSAADLYCLGRVSFTRTALRGRL